MPRWFRRLPLPAPLKHLAGSAWLMAGRLFAMGCIAGFGLAVFAGALSAIDSIFASRDTWFREGRLADLELRVATDDRANVPPLADLPGVAALRLRMLAPATWAPAASGAGQADRPPLRVLLIANAGLQAKDAATQAVSINAQRLLEGRDLDPADPHGVLVDRSFARYHGVSPGQPLPIRLQGELLPLHVRGVVSDAEFLLAPANPALFVPSKGSLGVVYLLPQQLESRYGFMPVNSVLFAAEPGADLEQLRQRVIERAQTRLSVDFTVTQAEQFSHRFLDKNLGVFRIVVPVIVAVSALSALFVTAFLFLQWVARERQTLALFLALGHPPARLALSFALMVAYLASGVVAGGLLMAGIVGQGFLGNFADALGLPMPVFAFTPQRVLLGVAGVAGVFALAAAVALARLLRLAPLDAMRERPAPVRAPGRLASAVGRWLPGSTWRLALRNLFRHRAVSSISIVAVALGFGTTAAFFIAYSSFIGTSARLVELNTWDAAVDFQVPLWDEEVARLVKAHRLEAVTPYTKGVAQAVRAGSGPDAGPRSRRVNLYAAGFDPAQPWHAAVMTAGEALSADQPEGMLLERSTAAELGVGVGDALVVEVQGRRRTAIVRGLFSGALPGEACFTLAFHRELADLEERSTGLFVRAGAAELARLARGLARHRDVQQVLTKADVTREILAASGQVTAVIRLGTMVSIGIAGLFVFACMGYTVLQRQREYQTLRLLGHGDGAITRSIVVEVALIGLAALLLAVPVGALVAQAINAALSRAWFQVDTVIGPADYLRTFAPGLLLLPLLAWPLARSVLRLPLEGALRAREIA